MSVSGDGAKLLVQTAIWKRRRLRSGRPLAWALVGAVVLFCAGAAPFVTAGFSNSSYILGRLIWFLVFLALALITAIRSWRNLHPSRPWGTAVTEPCPKCGRQGLRENVTRNGIRDFNIMTNYTGIVTLCTEECGFSRVRPPSIWGPGGILGGGGPASG
jgi:hypothetical protein